MPNVTPNRRPERPAETLGAEPSPGPAMPNSSAMVCPVKSSWGLLNQSHSLSKQERQIIMGAKSATSWNPLSSRDGACSRKGA